MKGAMICIAGGRGSGLPNSSQILTAVPAEGPGGRPRRAAVQIGKSDEADVLPFAGEGVFGRVFGIGVYSWFFGCLAIR